MMAGAVRPTRRSTGNFRSQTHSIVAVKVALYSALQLDVATVACFLLNQEMHEEPSMKQLPLWDLHVSEQPAQSISINPCMTSDELAL